MLAGEKMVGACGSLHFLSDLGTSSSAESEDEVAGVTDVREVAKLTSKRKGA